MKNDIGIEVDLGVPIPNYLEIIKTLEQDLNKVFKPTIKFKYRKIDYIPEWRVFANEKELNSLINCEIIDDLACVPSIVKDIRKELFCIFCQEISRELYEKSDTT